MEMGITPKTLPSLQIKLYISSRLSSFYSYLQRQAVVVEREGGRLAAEYPQEIVNHFLLPPPLLPYSSSLGTKFGTSSLKSCLVEWRLCSVGWSRSKDKMIPSAQSFAFVLELGNFIFIFILLTWFDLPGARHCHSQGFGTVWLCFFLTWNDNEPLCIKGKWKVLEISDYKKCKVSRGVKRVLA